MMSDLDQLGVVGTVGDFQLQQHELISGVPIFYIPKRAGVPCAVGECEILEAYNYCFSPVPLDIRVTPCSEGEWDRFAVCVFNGQMGSAVAAFGFPGSDLNANKLGWFTRYESQDLRWEYQVQ